MVLSAIAQKIFDKNAGYVLALKGIQSALHGDATLFAAQHKAAACFNKFGITRAETIDGDHSRIETRAVTVFDGIAWLRKRHDWPGLAAVVMVERLRDINGEVAAVTRYYITSLARTATLIAPVVQSYWAIENSLHRA